MAQFCKVWEFIHSNYEYIDYTSLDADYDEGFLDFGLSTKKPYRFYFNHRLDSYILFVYDVMDSSKVILKFYGLEHIFKFLSH
jgi:hypothetical protein